LRKRRGGRGGGGGKRQRPPNSPNRNMKENREKKLADFSGKNKKKECSTVGY
jgi:hypothetical protein